MKNKTTPTINTTTIGPVERLLLDLIAADEQSHDRTSAATLLAGGAPTNQSTRAALRTLASHLLRRLANEGHLIRRGTWYSHSAAVDAAELDEVVVGQDDVEFYGRRSASRVAAARSLCSMRRTVAADLQARIQKMEQRGGSR